MNSKERDELMIRMDELIKTVFNKMDDFETLFTNHLHHHEMWEKDIVVHMRWWMGMVLTIALAALGLERYIIGS